MKLLRNESNELLEIARYYSCGKCRAELAMPEPTGNVAGSIWTCPRGCGPMKYLGFTLKPSEKGGP